MNSVARRSGCRSDASAPSRAWAGVYLGDALSCGGRLSEVHRAPIFSYAAPARTFLVETSYTSPRYGTAQMAVCQMNCLMRGLLIALSRSM
jgi:hypothetical protein